MSLTGHVEKMRLSITLRSCLRELSEHKRRNGSIYRPLSAFPRKSVGTIKKPGLAL